MEYIPVYMQTDLRMIFLIQLRVMLGLTQTPDAITGTTMSSPLK